jgi:hypothetical protein
MKNQIIINILNKSLKEFNTKECYCEETFEGKHVCYFHRIEDQIKMVIKRLNEIKYFSKFEKETFLEAVEYCNGGYNSIEEAIEITKKTWVDEGSFVIVDENDNIVRRIYE